MDLIDLHLFLQIIKIITKIYLLNYAKNISQFWWAIANYIKNFLISKLFSVQINSTF